MTCLVTRLLLHGMAKGLASISRRLQNHKNASATNASKSVDADSIKDGRLMETLLKDWVNDRAVTPESFVKEKATTQAFPRLLRVSSGCSGSGTDHWIVSSVDSLRKLTGLPIQAELVWVCESKPSKQRWLRQLVPSTCSKDKLTQTCVQRNL